MTLTLALGHVLPLLVAVLCLLGLARGSTPDGRLRFILAWLLLTAMYVCAARVHVVGGVIDSIRAPFGLSALLIFVAGAWGLFFSVKAAFAATFFAVYAMDWGLGGRLDGLGAGGLADGLVLAPTMAAAVAWGTRWLWARRGRFSS
jgi:hypothetical protein